MKKQKICKKTPNGDNYYYYYFFKAIIIFRLSSKEDWEIQARIAQLVVYRLGTGEVPGSNPGKGENFSVIVSNWIVRI